jgi:hypothetical protein
MQPLWDDPLHVLWNAAAVASELAAVIGVVRVPAWQLRRGRWGKAGLIALAVLAGAAINGLAIPVGAIVTLGWLQRHALSTSGRDDR